ncbi:MAG TPA: CPBP family intramembrane metalloprotease [Candidatus Limadaptatus stercoravium]|nr:CPBP family intramembrane metalloprotease [Candidatus Limadaptatus stercoravium]
MKPRAGGGILYFLIIAMTLLMRISQGVGVADALGADIGVMFTLVVQLGCFGALPLVGWWIIVGGCRKDEIRTLTYAFGFRKCGLRDILRILAITVPLLLLVGVAANAWSNLLALIGYVRSPSVAEEQTVAALLSEIALTAVLPGVFEELTHRGELMAAYRGLGGKAVFVSALLFALMHQNIQQLAHTFVLGFVLAFVVYCTGSVFPAMFVHFFNNFISVVSGFGELVPAFGVVNTVSRWLYGTVYGMVALCVLAAASAVLVFFVLGRMKKDAVRAGRIPGGRFFASAEGELSLSRDMTFWAVVAIGVAAMLFSLSWGYL